MTAEDIATTPIGFVETTLELPLYPWQDKALAPLEFAISNRTKIAVVTPNGAGKSERIVAGAAIYWAFVHPRGKVVITTKDGRQLAEQVIPAIEKHLPRLQGWHSVRSPYYRVTTPTGGSITAFTTDDAGRVEGSHSDGPEAPLLWIVDEAKSVDEQIFQGIDRCTYDALMYTSSPGLMMGRFYEAFHTNREDFVTVQAGLKDCPHIPAEKVDDIIKTYGPDHPFTRSSVYGEFMDSDDGEQFVVSLAALTACLQSPPRHKPGMKVYFCDFAEGKAEHGIAYRDGNKVTIIDTWRESNKEAAAGRFIRNFQKEGLTTEEANRVWGDAADQVMLRLLAEAGWRINQKNFGSPARNDGVYQSWSAEALYELSVSITKGEVILDNDPILIKQLITTKRTLTARGKLGIEEKYEMAKRGLPSPDRRDIVMGCWNVFDSSQIVQAKQAYSIPSGFISRNGFGFQGAESFAEEMGAGVGL